MTGPKLNEKSYVAGERSGTKATAKYVRSSASKARAVLDLIRGLDVLSADEVLQFTDRHIAHDVRKVLASAVANAINNDSQDAEELFVIACFADEGPTLRRFRPRARGRATRINKRTCHITVIVARMSDDRLAIVQARRERQGGAGASGRPQSSASSRRARVERSRKDSRCASSRRSTRCRTHTTTRPIESDSGGRRRLDAGSSDRRRSSPASGPARPSRSTTVRCPRVSRSRATPGRCSTTSPARGTTRPPRPKSGSTPSNPPKQPASRSPAPSTEEAADADNTDDAAADEAEES